MSYCTFNTRTGEISEIRNYGVLANLQLPGVRGNFCGEQPHPTRSNYILEHDCGIHPYGKVGLVRKPVGLDRTRNRMKQGNLLKQENLLFQNGNRPMQQHGGNLSANLSATHTEGFFRRREKGGGVGGGGGGGGVAGGVGGVGGVGQRKRQKAINKKEFHQEGVNKEEILNSTSNTNNNSDQQHQARRRFGERRKKKQPGGLANSGGQRGGVATTSTADINLKTIDQQILSHINKMTTNQMTTNYDHTNNKKKFGDINLKCNPNNRNFNMSFDKKLNLMLISGHETGSQRSDHPSEVMSLSSYYTSSGGSSGSSFGGANSRLYNTFTDFGTGKKYQITSFRNPSPLERARSAPNIWPSSWEPRAFVGRGSWCSAARERNLNVLGASSNYDSNKI